MSRLWSPHRFWVVLAIIILPSCCCYPVSTTTPVPPTKVPPPAVKVIEKEVLHAETAGSLEPVPSGDWHTLGAGSTVATSDQGEGLFKLYCGEWRLWGGAQLKLDPSSLDGANLKGAMLVEAKCPSLKLKSDAAPPEAIIYSYGTTFLAAFDPARHLALLWVLEGTASLTNLLSDGTQDVTVRVDGGQWSIVRSGNAPQSPLPESAIGSIIGEMNLRDVFDKVIATHPRPSIISPTPTPSPSSIPSLTPTASPTATPTGSRTPTAAPTRTPTPTRTRTPTPTYTPTYTPTKPPSPIPTVVGYIPIGRDVLSVALDPSKSSIAYVTDTSGGISRVDLGSGKVTAFWQVAKERLHGIAVHPKGDPLYVSTEGRYLYMVSTVNGNILKSVDLFPGEIPVSTNRPLALSGDGSKLFVSDHFYQSQDLFEIDTATLARTKWYVGHGPTQPDADYYGNWVLVPGFDDDNVTLCHFYSGVEFPCSSVYPVSGGPTSARMTEDRTKGYITTGVAPGRLYRIDLPGGKLTPLTLPNGQFTAALSPDETRLVAAANTVGEVYIIDVPNWRLLRTLPVSTTSIAISSDSRTAYATEGTINVLAFFSIR